MLPLPFRPACRSYFPAGFVSPADFEYCSIASIKALMSATSCWSSEMLMPFAAAALPASAAPVPEM